MPFYKKRADFHTIENTCEPFLLFLRQNCEVLKIDDGDMLNGVKEAFFCRPEELKMIERQYKSLYEVMRYADYIAMQPVDLLRTAYIVYILEDKKAFTPTISKIAYRLPKLSHLITLTPEDFFAVFQILEKCRPVAVGSALIMPADTYIPSAIAPFFITNDKSWKINPDFADSKWTNIDDVLFIAQLDVTERNQLYAMQYLTARQNSDLLYFPVESAVALELEWDQVNEDYVIPQDT